jgi:hypothetical protein
MAKKIQIHGSFTSSDSDSMTWRGAWKDNESYSYGDVVQYNGSVYVVGVEDVTIPAGVTPIDDPNNWHLLASGATSSGSDGVVINF